MRPHEFELKFKFSGQPDIVRIQKCQIVTPRTLNRLVTNSGGISRVGKPHHSSAWVTNVSQVCPRLIARTVVCNNELPIRMRLGHYGVDRPSQVLQTIE